MKLHPLSVSPGRLLALGLCALLASACQSTMPVPKGSPLPFHVALMPVEIHDTTKLTATPTEPLYPQRSSQKANDDMHLELGTKEVSEALARELGRAFVRTTLLQLPKNPEDAGKNQAERERYWQDRARAAGADLLVRTRLIIDPNIEGDHNEKFWLNVPLWLMLGGPFCWFVSDRSYVFSARLQAEVFDTSEGHETLSEYALLPIPLYAEFKGADMTLIDRADDVGDYFLSIIVPAGLLARETEEVEEVLEIRLPEELARELAHKVFAERQQFEQNLALGGFKLDAQAASLEPAADGRVRVRVPVQQLPGAGALLSYELASGNTVLNRNFQAATAGSAERFIEEEMTLPPGAEYLTVRVVDARRNTRSYTLKVAPANR